MTDLSRTAINQDDIRTYLKKFCGNNSSLENLVMVALPDLIAKFSPALVEVKPGQYMFQPLVSKRLAGYVVGLVNQLDADLKSGAAWLADMVDGKPRRLLQLASLEDALQPWIEEKAAGDQELLNRRREEALAYVEKDDDVITIMTFTDGYRIIRLQTEAAALREAAFMDKLLPRTATPFLDDLTHIHSYMDQNLKHSYSLRDPANCPCLTFDVHVEPSRIVLVQDVKYLDISIHLLRHIATFCQRFKVDMADAFMEEDDVVETDQAAFETFHGLDEGQRKIFKADPVVLQDHETVSDLKIENMLLLKKWPVGLRVEGQAYFLGDVFPGDPPQDLKVKGAILTDSGVFATVESFLERFYPSAA